MLTRREGAIAYTHIWDAENRSRQSASTVTASPTPAMPTARVKKIEDGQTTTYIGNLYEKNVTANTVTTYHYAGSQRIAQRH